MASFVDRVVLHAVAGNGGHGAASIHREKFKPLGGPDGGNGGHGGDVVFVVDPNVHTLLDFHFHPHQKAGNGKQGMGSLRAGAIGESLELRVPDGKLDGARVGRAGRRRRPGPGRAGSRARRPIRLQARPAA